MVSTSGQAGVGGLRAPDPEVWAGPLMRPALAARDIGSVYRTLQRSYDLGQCDIGALTGQSQTEVSLIASGHRSVRSFELLSRIAGGLRTPPGYLGLACCPCPHTVPPATVARAIAMATDEIGGGLRAL